MANYASNLKGFFKRNPLGGASLMLVVFLLTVGITSDLLVGDGKNGDITFTGWSETQGDYTYMSGPPNGDHWFGTDQTGRDIFSRIIMGTKRSLIVAIVSVAAGTSVGAAAAPALSGIPFVGWLASGWVAMFGGNQGAEIGGNMASSISPDR